MSERSPASTQADKRRFATLLAERLASRFTLAGGVVIGIAGESGSGKSVTATGLARALGETGVAVAVLHQDNYFRLPPRTNHDHRVRDLANVGPHEVDLALLQAHIADFRARRSGIVAPVVNYPANRFDTQHLDFSRADVLVVEGTFALQLTDLDIRVFLDATHHDTAERRRRRNRDLHEPIIDRILEIEHAIIARQERLAHFVVDRDFAIHDRSTDSTE